MKIRPNIIDPFTGTDLARKGLTQRVIDRDKVLFVASFDLIKLLQKKTIREIASFFNTKDETIKTIIEMQRENFDAEQAFPDIFINEEDLISVTNEWELLKQTDLYKKLKHERENRNL